MCFTFVSAPMTDIFAISHLSDYERVKLFEVVGTPSSDYNLRDPKVKELIDSDNLSFDLVINEDFYHDSWLMFGYKFNAPTITICKWTKNHQGPQLAHFRWEFFFEINEN